MWSGLESAATVAQAVGLDVGGLISMIGQAARTARQNTKDCEHLARRVGLLADLLPRCLQDPEARRALAGLDATLLEAHGLVMSCQARKGIASQLLMASRQTDRFRDVERKIDAYLSVVPVVSYIGIARRLDDNGHHSTSRLSQSSLNLSSGGGAEDHREFTLAEVVVATNNFAVVLSADADTGTKVYKGKLLLQSGHELVAVKRLNRGRQGAEDAFFKEQHWVPIPWGIKIFTRAGAGASAAAPPSASRCGRERGCSAVTSRHGLRRREQAGASPSRVWARAARAPLAACTGTSLPDDLMLAVLARLAAAALP